MNELTIKEQLILSIILILCFSGSILFVAFINFITKSNISDVNIVNMGILLYFIILLIVSFKSMLKK